MSKLVLPLKPPPHPFPFLQATPGLLVRSGEVYRGQTISELGVYSTFLKASSG